MEQFNSYFDQTLDSLDASQLKEAMGYALFNSGKKLRVQLALATAKLYGIDETLIYPLASAIEMVHTYSLVHDDLPAMDNDDLRRGKPTVHKIYGEAMGILVGDALLSESMKQLSLYNGPNLQQIMRIFSEAIGGNGMVLGQVLDMDAENKHISSSELQTIHHLKTGKLIALPSMVVALAANHIKDVEKFEKLGLKIGLAFQIQDDILDVTSTSEQMGKTMGKDSAVNKSTAVQLLGLENAQSYVQTLLEEVLLELQPYEQKDQSLSQIYKKLVKRDK